MANYSEKRGEAQVNVRETSSAFRQCEMDMRYSPLRLVLAIAIILTFSVFLVLFCVATFGPFHIGPVVRCVARHASSTFLPQNAFLTSQDATIRWDRKVEAFVVDIKSNSINYIINNTESIHLPDISISLYPKNTFSISGHNRLINIRASHYTFSVEDYKRLVTLITYKDTTYNNSKYHKKAHLQRLKNTVKRAFQAFTSMEFNDIILQIPRDGLSRISGGIKNTSNIDNITDAHQYTIETDESQHNQPTPQYRTLYVHHLGLYEDFSHNNITGNAEIYQDGDADKIALDFTLHIGSDTSTQHWLSRGTQLHIMSTEPLIEVNIRDVSTKLAELFSTKMQIPFIAKMDGSFRIYISDELSISRVVFFMSSTNNPTLHYDGYKDVEFQSITLKGDYSSGPNATVNVQSACILKERPYDIAFGMSYNLDTEKLSLQFAGSGISTDDVYRYWPDHFLQETRTWLVHNLSASTVTSADVKLLFDLSKHSTTENMDNSYFSDGEEVDGNILLHGGVLKYEYPDFNVHEVMLEDTQVKFNKKEVKIYVHDAKTADGLMLSHYTTTISGLDEQNSGALLTIDGNILSSVPNGILSAINHLYPDNIHNTTQSISTSITSKMETSAIDANDTHSKRIEHAENMANKMLRTTGMDSDTASSVSQDSKILNALDRLRHAHGKLMCAMKLSLPLSQDSNYSIATENAQKNNKANNNSVTITNNNSIYNNFSLDCVLNEFDLVNAFGTHGITSKKLSVKVNDDIVKIHGDIKVDNAAKLTVDIQHKHCPQSAVIADISTAHNNINAVSSQNNDIATNAASSDNCNGNTVIEASFHDLSITQLESMIGKIPISNIANGNMSGKVKAEFISNGTAFNALFNLQDSHIFSNELSFSKPRGVGGSLSLDTVVYDTTHAKKTGDTTDNATKEKVQKASYVVQMPDIYSSGTLHYYLKDENGGIDILDASSTKTKLRGSRFGFRYVKHNTTGNTNGTTRHNITITGQSFDMSGFSISEIDDVDTEFNFNSNINITFNVNEIILQNDQKLYQPKFNISCIHGVCNNVFLHGNLGANDESQTTILSNSSKMQVSSSDAGKLLKAFGLYKNMRKGALDLAVDLRKDGSFYGWLTIRSFVIQNAPVLVELLKVASILSILDMLKVGQISFDQLKCHVESSNDKISFENCNISGGVASITGNGYYNFRNQHVSFRGYIASFNLIENLMYILKKSVGPRHTNNKVDRAFNFSIEGELDGKMQVHSRPLSVVMPGFLGQVFAKTDDNTGHVPHNNDEGNITHYTTDDNTANRTKRSDVAPPASTRKR